jgi:hypothetical protein
LKGKFCEVIRYALTAKNDLYEKFKHFSEAAQALVSIYNVNFVYTGHSMGTT